MPYLSGCFNGLFPDARTFPAAVIRVGPRGLEAFARKQVRHKRPNTSIRYTAVLNNGMQGVLNMCLGELDKCTFFSEFGDLIQIWHRVSVE